VWLTPRPGRFIPEKRQVPIVQETGWTPRPVWTRAENLARTEIRSPDRLACSDWLYRSPGPVRKCRFELKSSARYELVIAALLKVRVFRGGDVT
jgi:hypothetical protein